MGSETGETRHRQTRANTTELPGPLDASTKCPKCTWLTSEEGESHDLESVLAQFQDTCAMCTIWKRCLQVCQAAAGRARWVRVYNNHINMHDYEFCLYKDPGLPCPLPLPERPDVAHRADSKQCLEYARYWLTKCQTEHAECSLAMPTQLPTRVLDITHNQPRLLVSNGQVGSYAALSYCWGSKMNFTTTRDMLDSFTAEISDVNIPATIKDAIRVAKSLGYQYLWIDALCIIQDDPQDWQREAGRMAQVYGNADLVLAASSATDSYEGFLNHERRHRGGSVYFFDERDPAKSYCIKYGLGPRYQMTLDEGPLTKRAWAFQEKMLARRYLCYSPEELSWHCNAIETCECSYGRRSKHFLHDSARSAWGGPTDDSDMNIARLTSPGKSTSDIHEIWISHIVPMYTKRQLSRQTDRIVAISAVATRLEQRLRDVFRFGLWESRMVHQLGWERYMSRDQCTPGVPTWSWASVSGYVNYDEETHRAGANTKFYPMYFGLYPLESHYLSYGRERRICVLKGKVFAAWMHFDNSRCWPSNLTYVLKATFCHNKRSFELPDTTNCVTVRLDTPLVYIKYPRKDATHGLTTLRNDAIALPGITWRSIYGAGPPWSQVWCMPYSTAEACRLYPESDNESDNESDFDRPFKVLRHTFMLLGRSLRYPGAFERLGLIIIYALSHEIAKDMGAFLEEVALTLISIV